MKIKKVEPRGEEDVDQVVRVSENPVSDPGNEVSQEDNTLDETPFPDSENPSSDSSDAKDGDAGLSNSEEA